MASTDDPERKAREGRLAVLRELKKRIESEPSCRLPRTPEELIREDRER
jgi:hypothetical protein